LVKKFPPWIISTLALVKIPPRIIPTLALVKIRSYKKKSVYFSFLFMILVSLNKLIKIYFFSNMQKILFLHFLFFYFFIFLYIFFGLSWAQTSKKHACIMHSAKVINLPSHSATIHSRWMYKKKRKKNDLPVLWRRCGWWQRGGPRLLTAFPPAFLCFCAHTL
jgi:Ca2+/Na+ antiporter